jgi:hypothetical protein
MARSRWKQSRDPLLRGDTKGGVAVPDPAASASLVRHSWRGC